MYMYKRITFLCDLSIRFLVIFTNWYVHPSLPHLPIPTFFLKRHESFYQN